MEDKKINYLDCILEILKGGLISLEEAKILHAASRIQNRILLDIDPGVYDVNDSNCQKEIVKETQIMFLDPKFNN